MDLTHQFSVPTPVEDTWAHFQDIASVAECFPGAQVTGVDGDSFNGTVKVKLGPIALTYAGSGTFVDKDDAAHRFVVEAKGRDKRGNGTAGATVALSMDAASDGGTDVEVKTDLSITGKPAQFGRGVMQDVSDKLLGQFVTCLEQRLGDTATKVPDVSDGAPAGDASGTSGTVGDGEGSAAETDPAPAPASTGAGSAGGSAGGAGSTGSTSYQPPQDDALDLGAAVLPVLARSYWRQGVAGLVALLVLVRLVRRTRR